MPLYAYTCNNCDQPFDKLVRSADSATDVACPSCGSASVKKQLSSFAAKISGTSFGSRSDAACAPGRT